MHRAKESDVAGREVIFDQIRQHPFAMLPFVLSEDGRQVPWSLSEAPAE